MPSAGRELNRGDAFDLDLTHQVNQLTTSPWRGRLPALSQELKFGTMMLEGS